jgi:hypothetical protein
LGVEPAELAVALKLAWHGQAVAPAATIRILAHQEIEWVILGHF